MAIVGIIPNPASGKDIRRLVGHALVIGNREKTTIVRRMLVGLYAAGVRDVRIMPDTFGIGLQAIHDLKGREAEVAAIAGILEMDVTGSALDTARAARVLCAEGAGCIITLGGDGTVRIAAKGCSDIPILPVSTGTNNVLPQFIEGTIAGLAAGFVARQPEVGLDGFCYRSKRLDILVNGSVVDSALVDVAAVAGMFAGARAVWKAGDLRQIAVTRASPASIGLSAVVGLLQPISTGDAFGALVEVASGDGSRLLSAPLGPGLMAEIPVRDLRVLEPGSPSAILSERPLMLALDGEREVSLQPGDEAAVVLRMDGPWIVDVERVLGKASLEGWLVSNPGSNRPVA